MNIYDNPEKFGCRILGEVELGGGYSFDKFVVWIGPGGLDKGLGWKSDSGCSCPDEFCDMGIPDLMWGRAPQCERELRQWHDNHDESTRDDAQLARLLAKVWNPE